MARIRTGRPTGRPPLERENKEAVVDMHIHIPMALIEKLDRLRKGAETRKDILMRIVKEYPE
jgi:hypothetical protein